MKFLVDECLSPELTKLAQARGFGESSHVVWLGRAGLKDWELKPLILEGDWDICDQEFLRLPWPGRQAGDEGPVFRSRDSRWPGLSQRSARDEPRHANRAFRAGVGRVGGVRPRSTVWASHFPPRAVATPRPFRAAAIWRSDLVPAPWASRIAGMTTSANARLAI